MKAAVLAEFGGPEVIEITQEPDPEPGPGQVVVDVKACGLNHLDIWVRTQPMFPRPIIPGSDIAGIVSAVGPGITDVEPGFETIVFPAYTEGRSRQALDGYYPVCPTFGMLGSHCNGGCAEKALVPAANALAKPRNISWVEGAALPITFVTAYHMLFSRAKIKAGETILIQSAGSGVGSVAVQMAKLAGATVIASTGSDEKVKRAKKLGADHVINYKTESVPKAVRKITDRHGADVVMDHNGPTTFESSMKSLSRGGRYVTCGSTGGPEVTLNLSALFYKAQSILGSTMGTAGELADAIQLVADGKIKPIIDKTFPLDELRAAHEYLESPERFGKVVIEVS
jgi:NADPH:quinone reductase-like Zn-dependent oxidoreductase